MARISELHYSNAYANSSGVSEFLEIALDPSEDPSDFVASFYNANGAVGFEVSLDDPGVSVSTGAGGELVYVISADVYPIRLTDPNGNGANNYEAYALTNTDTNEVVDFYDIGGGTSEILALDGAAAGATSENIPVLSGPGTTTTTLQFNQPDPDNVTYETVDPGATGVICFVRGAMVSTPEGPKLIESLRPGDLVTTQDNGPKPIQWIGQRTVSGTGDLAPIQFDQGFLGATQPHSVSPNHRILLTGAHAEILFGESEVLVPAKALLHSDQTRRLKCDFVTYFHFMFDQHEIVTVDGVASESFYPGATGLSAMETAARDEVLMLFPELSEHDGHEWPAARMVTSMKEGMVIASLL
ncbi:Hint domain-containing protein [Shimia sp.]|uniref:Hint domain-containing protein n=1 Tax=Shimia sp. TaxID=1954381 RepID=UPI003B8DC243